VGHLGEGFEFEDLNTIIADLVWFLELPETKSIVLQSMAIIPLP
jgi:hypothetical protein